jgi:hypothetical protein
MARAQRKKLAGNHPGIYYRDTSRGRIYDFHYYENGKKKWGKPDTDLRRVEKERARLVYEAKFGRPLESAPPTLGAYIDTEWEPHAQARALQGTLSSGTLKQYQADVRKHLRPAFGDRRLDSIDVAAVERFQSKLTIGGQSNHSVRRLVNTLDGVASFSSTPARRSTSRALWRSVSRSFRPSSRFTSWRTRCPVATSADSS